MFISNVLLQLLCFLLFLFFPFLFLPPPCSSSSCFFPPTYLPCSSPYLPSTCFFNSKYLSCKVNPPAATPQERGLRHFQVKCAGSTVVATEATLARKGELHSELWLRMPVETNLPSVLWSFPPHPSLEHCRSGRPGTNGTWTVCWLVLCECNMG